VEELEQRYALSLPADFRRYLIEASPAEDLWDPEDVVWWSVASIKNIPDQYEHGASSAYFGAAAASYLLFADYSVSCWAWAICCSNGPSRGQVALIGGAPDRIVAGSFSEFVELYLRDPRLVGP